MDIDTQLVKSLGVGFKKAFFYHEGLIVVNLATKKILINNTIYNFSDIIDWNISTSIEHDASIDLVNAFNAAKGTSTTKTDTGSLIGRTIIGGVLGGVPGAVIGGVTAKKTTYEFPASLLDSSYRDYTIVLTVNNLNNPTITIHIGNSNEKTNELINLFKVIKFSTHNPQNDNSENIDVSKHLSALYKQAREAKNKINTNKINILHLDTNITIVNELYLQILVNDVESEEAKFYHFFFDTIVNRSTKYDHKYSKLFKLYQTYLQDYLKSITKDSDNQKLVALIHDTIVYARCLSSGYSDEVMLGYQLLLRTGDLIEDLYGTAKEDIFTAMWEAGIAMHHDENFMHPKKVDLSSYVEKIQHYNQNYEEPNKNNGPSFIESILEEWDSDSCLGCLAGIVIIGLILYFAFL